MGGRVKDVRHTWGTREYGIWDMENGMGSSEFCLGLLRSGSDRE